MSSIHVRSWSATPILLLFLVAGVFGADDEPWLGPYDGPSRGDVDASTLDGKVLCGYQGWFNTPGDGTNFGFTHWGQRLDQPERAHFTVDLWPDVSEYDPADLHDVPGLKMPDGSPARLYQRVPQGAGPAAHEVDARSTASTACSSAGSSARRPTPPRPARQHGARQPPRGLPSRRPRLGDDARPLDGPPGQHEDGQGRLEVPLRPGQGPRGLALPAPPGQAGRAALGARIQGPPLEARIKAGNWSTSSRTIPTTAASI